MLVKEIIWDNSLSVQVPEIDEDHRKLVGIFNMLSRSLKEGDSPDYIEAVLEELISCVVWHFSHEERLMLKYAYGDRLEHRKEHQELIMSARELQSKFLAEGRMISADDISFLEHWLTGHIYAADMEMGAYLSSVM
jgi:hemerythrin